jgi:hypothetical protein
MTRLPFSRRNFIRSTCATALLAPFAHQLAFGTRKARAAAPKRVMFVYVPDGCIPEKWHAQGAGTSFTLPEMSSPLEVIKDRLVFLSGLTMYAGGATHEGGIAKVLTGVSDISLDVFLGDKIGGTTPHKSIQLGVGTTFQNGSGSMSFIGPNQPVNPDDDPLNAFSRIFGSVGGGNDEDLEKRKKKSVLDAALADLNGVRQKLGAVEKQKLDVHLASLREVEARLTNDVSKACDVGTFNSVGFSVNPMDYYPKTYHKEDKFQTVGRLQMDLAALSLSCGASNVVSLMWSHPVSPTKLVDTGVNLGNHDASHYGEATSETAKNFITLKQWFMREFVYLIEKLEATPDDGGSLLDNTLVLLCSELGDSNRHDHDNMPFVLAGGAGGKLETGRSLQFNGKNNGQNEPHSKLLVSIANAMDVDIDSYGYTGHGKGGLSGLLK